MNASGKQFRKRNAILGYLMETTSHPSAETVYTELKQQIPDLSIGTVYRNLNLFRQQGLAEVVATVNGVERFDGNTQPHVHFICSHCASVSDLMEIQIPASLQKAAANSCGGQVDQCQLSFTGLCSACIAKKERSESA